MILLGLQVSIVHVACMTIHFATYLNHILLLQN